MQEVDVEQAYQRYFPVVRDKCSRMLKDPAEAQDVAQETFTRLWSSRASFHNQEGIAAWIYQTSTRLAVDRYRRLSKAGVVAFPVDELLSRHNDNPESLVGSRRQLADLGRRTPAKELEAAVLSRLDGLNHDEIAQVMATSDRSVRRLLARFDQRLVRWRAEESA